MGQVAMTTKYGNWQTMLTGDVGSPIGRRLSGTWEEAAMGPWTVCLLHGAPLGLGEASEGRANGVQISSLTTVQNTI